MHFSTLALLSVFAAVAGLAAGEDDAFRYTEKINPDHSRSIAQIQVLYGDVFGGMQPMDSIEELKAKFAAARMSEAGWTLTEEEAYVPPKGVPWNDANEIKKRYSDFAHYAEAGFVLAPLVWIPAFPEREKT